ncbi:HAD family hydrolase, partial [Streptomyces sp. TRM76130]|nr:HAD family hydrolase [Streptomyces sp. TRM76130]
AAAVTCRPEVLEGLTRLRAAAWTIGVATNGAGDIQRAKLAGTGLASLVDGVAVSGDLEIRKPDLRLFGLAASRCGVSLADGGWMVGDNPAGDIRGGHRAGLRTIWLRGRPWPD